MIILTDNMLVGQTGVKHYTTRTNGTHEIYDNFGKQNSSETKWDTTRTHETQNDGKQNSSGTQPGQPKHKIYLVVLF